MNRSPVHLLAVLALLVTSATTVTLAGAQEHVARIGHLESPQQSRHVHLEKVAELVAERTGGAVEFQLFPQAQLGDQRTMTEAVQLGSLEATVAPAAFLGGFNPAVSILDIPYLLPEDEDAAQAMREGPFGQALLDSFTDKGVVAIALWPNGRKDFTSREPIDRIEDFAGQKFRVMDSKILIEQFAALGASAVVLPFSELYTSLQTGVVEGQENPLDTIRAMKFFEVQDYLVISDHGAMEDVVLFSPSFWNALPENYRSIIDEAFDEVVPALRAHKAEAVADALAEIERSGTDVRTASAEEREALRAAMTGPATAAYEEIAGDAAVPLLEAYEKARAAR